MASSRNAKLYELADVLHPAEITHNMLLSSCGALSTIDSHSLSAFPVPSNPEHLNNDLSRAAVKLFYKKYCSTLFKSLSEQELDVAIDHGLKDRPPCRFEMFELQFTDKNADCTLWEQNQSWVPVRIGPEEVAQNCRSPKVYVLFDIAHNEAAIRTLVAKVKMQLPNSHLRCCNLNYESHIILLHFIDMN